MSLRRIEPGKRMSQAVVHGATVYLAGQVADKAAGGPVADQMHEILSAIDRLLVEAGSNKRKLQSATVYLADIRGFADMNAAWDAWVAPGHTPARATVEAKLAGPQYLVEIACVAACG